MTDQASHRRRFQFRLRTLLIVVALLAVPLSYVGWQAKIVRQRNQFRDRLNDADSYPMLFGIEDPYNYGDGIAGIRGWMGDHEAERIWFYSHASDAELDEARNLFPEAEIIRLNVP